MPGLSLVSQGGGRVGGEAGCGSKSFYKGWGGGQSFLGFRSTFGKVMAESVSEAVANQEAVEAEAVASVAVTVLSVAIVRLCNMSGADSLSEWLREV